MKRIRTKNLLYITIAIILTVVMMQTGIIYGAENKMNITLRIESTENNIYYKTVEITYDEETLTLKQALAYIDGQENDLNIKGIETNYITEINGVVTGTFGGYDGWLYRVNNQEAALGINDLELKEGDSVVFYYGDPFGVGMQFPEADFSNIKDGIIKFTSKDTTYDEQFNPTTNVNPVAGATVTWNYNNEKAEYTTDENGEIKINKGQMTPGSHIIQISKVSDTGIPLVLRYAGDFAAEIEEEPAHTQNTKPVEPERPNTLTGDDFGSEPYITVILSVTLIILMYIFKKKYAYKG